VPVTTLPGGDKIWQKRDRRRTLTTYVGYLIAAIAFLIAWRFISEQTLWFFVWDAPRQAGDLISRMFPPQWGYSERLWRPMWDTINIATLGTLLGVVISVPIAFLAARNTTPHPIVRQAAMVIIVFSRSVNSLIWALLLVSILGPGLFAGILAIGLRSIGFCTKLLFEAIEEINPKPIEALTAAGSTGSQVIGYGIVPQVLPAFAGTTLYRWDINIRSSTVVGLVGAGGIGIQLNASINALQWDRVTIIFIMIIVLVLAAEWVSAKVRGSIQ
jgi:phosphonate transport system permease protein